MAARPRTPLEEDQLFQLAARLLSIRARSEQELRAKLIPRAARTGAVEAVMRRLRESGLLDDRKFAESFAAARRENQGFGQARVLADLRRARVAAPVAQEAVSRAYEEADELQMVREFLDRRFRNAPAGWADDPKRVAAAFRQLRRAGFTAANSLAVLRKMSRQAGVLEALENEPGEDEGHIPDL